MTVDVDKDMDIFEAPTSEEEKEKEEIEEEQESVEDKSEEKGEEEVTEDENEKDEEETGEDEKSESKSDSEDEEDQTEVQQLRSQLDNLTALVEQYNQAQSTQEQEEARQIKVEDVEFVTEDEAETVLSSANGLNTLLNKVRQETLATAREMYLQEGPGIVDAQVRETVVRQNQVADFFRKNPDLSSNRSFVRWVASQMEGKHPDWTPKQVVDGLADEVRKRLKLTAPAKKKPAKKKKKPGAFAKAKGTRKPASKKVSQEMQDISDIID